MDFHKRVPKDYLGNLKYRLALRQRANEDLEFRKALRGMCRVDPLFFFNAFAWAFEPRRKKGKDGKTLGKVLPFITWPHQDPAIQLIHENLGVDDIIGEKSRDQGASWIGVWFAVRDLALFEHVAIRFSSYIEKMVDSPTEDSLFWKVETGLKLLPNWMGGIKGLDWNRHVQSSSFSHHWTNSSLMGYAATSSLASGGRCDWFMIDELSKIPQPQDEQAVIATQAVTNSRLIIATPNGSIGAYYDIMHSDSDMARFILDWRDNPTQNRGMYRFIHGKPVAIDPVNNPLPPDYDPPNVRVLALFARLRKKGFKLEEVTRSPWFDKQCDRMKATPQSIAQELERDYGGSKRNIFRDQFREAIDEMLKPPLLIGEVSYDPETLSPSWEATPDGICRLWCPLDHNDKPPTGKYAVAADIGSGLGGNYTSNSVIEVVDLATKEQVAEFTSNIIPQADFADLAMAVANWFHGAFLAWEHNNASGFTNRVLEKNYPDIFERTVAFKRSKRNKGQKKAGWWTDPATKKMMLSDIDIAVREGNLIIRSTSARDEFCQYIETKEGLWEHQSHVSDKAHGDRVIALAVLLQAMKVRPVTTPGREAIDPEHPPMDTLAYRNRQRALAAQLRDDVWDHTDAAGMVGVEDRGLAEIEMF